MMDFYEVLDTVIDLLRSRPRVTYRVLKRQFNLDDDIRHTSAAYTGACLTRSQASESALSADQ